MMDQIIRKIEEWIPTKKVDVFGKGQWMKTSIPYYMLAVLTCFGYITFYTHAWIFMVIIYAILPALDSIFSNDTTNPTEAERRQLQENDPYFKAALYVTMLMDWALFLKTMNYFVNMQFNAWECYNLIGLLFIFSNLNAVQFAVAHEVFHKQGKFYRYLGTIHMVKNLYMHFTVQHLYGHHKKVATLEDPATSRQGENVYQFFVRSFFGSYKSVYKMESQSKKPFFLNAAVLSIASSIVFTLGIFYFYGMQATILFLLEAFLSIFVLETINYVEHYGLLRQKLPNGQYQKVTIRHSWNASYRFTNYLLFKLQRHSDHHENSLKPYQTLVSMDESPHLPHGYSLMIIMAYFPNVWFSIMDPLVNQYKRVKIGTAKTELMEKAHSDTNKFEIKLAFCVIFCWAVTFLPIWITN